MIRTLYMLMPGDLLVKYVILVLKLCLELCQFARVFTRINDDVLLACSLKDLSSKPIMYNSLPLVLVTFLCIVHILHVCPLVGV